MISTGLCLFWEFGLSLFGLSGRCRNCLSGYGGSVKATPRLVRVNICTNNIVNTPRQKPLIQAQWAEITITGRSGIARHMIKWRIQEDLILHDSPETRGIALLLGRAAESKAAFTSHHAPCRFCSRGCCCRRYCHQRCRTPSHPLTLR